jgi:5'-3' exonuclease
MVVHLLDGTYELFRQFYGRRRGGQDRELGAMTGVLHSVLESLEGGATHIGVATDHVIESFRNGLWTGYKTGAGVDPALLAQFEPLEEALAAMGVAVWPMVEYEADDALASVAAVAAASSEVEQVRIWTPDKDLAQCVRGHRVVQVDRRAGEVRDAEAIKAKFGVEPQRIPDWLALVGDSADGFPGIAGIGKVSAARLIEQHGALEEFPDSVLGQRRELALLFKDIATLRDDLPCIRDVDELRWRGATPELERWAERAGDARLLARSRALA